MSPQSPNANEPTADTEQVFGFDIPKDYPYRPTHRETVVGAWIAAVLVLAGIGALIWRIGPWVKRAAIASWHWADNPAHSLTPAREIWHTVNAPINTYITAHAQGLPVPSGTLHVVWVLAGLFILVRARRYAEGFGVQAAAVLYGALTVGMVWAGTAPAGRSVAAGLTALLWGLAASFALRGSLITTYTTVRNDVTPTPVTITNQIPAPRVENVTVDVGLDVQRLEVDINGRRLVGDDLERLEDEDDNE
ncbi:hypothetical protein ACEZCY_35910 [Streptacidiphilus sp. N1-12]|uniref:Uncharacterized protein n=1 Tax=Streptacidiphilus alkalitolerans TaxID=3342712 RepID=A0ABV6WRB1_9ACTN